MMLIEMFVPQGSLTEEQRLRVSERLVTAVMSAENAPADLLARGRAMTYVAIHESAALVSGRPPGATDPPQYVVRVSVPGAHNTDAIRAEIVARVTRVLAELDDDPQRLYREPHAWVQIIEVPEAIWESSARWSGSATS
jgi:phenylpyruvate tautomerase PptA (4-oxalocrotonate tautomerase family)